MHVVSMPEVDFYLERDRKIFSNYKFLTVAKQLGSALPAWMDGRGDTRLREKGNGGPQSIPRNYQAH